MARRLKICRIRMLCVTSMTRLSSACLPLCRPSRYGRAKRGAMTAVASWRSHRRCQRRSGRFYNRGSHSWKQPYRRMLRGVYKRWPTARAAPWCARFWMNRPVPVESITTAQRFAGCTGFTSRAMATSGVTLFKRVMTWGWDRGWSWAMRKPYSTNSLSDLANLDQWRIGLNRR